MGKTATAFSFLILLTTVSTLAADRDEFCLQSKNLDYFKIQAYKKENHLAIQNYGGLLNGGVCWWHSLFQRSALYTTLFYPGAPKPDLAEKWRIVHGIASGQKMNVITGYSNINEFSRDNWRLIQEKLEDWQKIDGFLKQAWIKSVLATWTLDPQILSEKMDKIYKSVEGRKHIEWVMLKINGIGAHAWLIVNMAKTVNGYELAVIDSNYPESNLNIKYDRGMSDLRTSVGTAIPYPGRNGFFKDFTEARNLFCDHKRMMSAQGLKPLNNDFN